MLEWLHAPMDAPTGVWGWAGLYGLMLVGMLVVANVQRVLGYEPESNVTEHMRHNDTRGRAILFVSVTFIAPFEEVVFRWIPFVLLGPLATGIGTAIWAVLHGWRNALPVMAMGIVGYRLVLGGHIVEAMLLHGFHNMLVISLAYFEYRMGWDE